MSTSAESDFKPDAESLLRSIAAAAPSLWFPQRFAETQSIPRELLNEPLWLLRQAGLVEVGDWIKGLGQGLRLSGKGEKALTSPTPLVPQEPDIVPQPRSDRGDRPTELERGDEARSAMLDPPPAVLAPSLMYANIAWFAVGCLIAWRGGVGMEFVKGDGHSGMMDVLMRSGAISASAVWDGGWWRLVTSCFVHIGLFHLLCNMLMLGMMGPFAEGLWGWRRFITIYFVAGIVGNMVAVALRPLSETGAELVLAGASGALFGMLASVIVWVIRNRRHLPADLTRDWFRRLLLIVMLNMVVSFVPGVSTEAHFGGAVAGAVVSWALAASPGRVRFWGVVSVVSVFAVACGLMAFMMSRADAWNYLRHRDSLTRTLNENAEGRLESPDERSIVLEIVGKDLAALSPEEVKSLRNSFEVEQKARTINPNFTPRNLLRRAETMSLRARDVANRLAEHVSEPTAKIRNYFLAVANVADAITIELNRTPPVNSTNLDAVWQAYTQAVNQLGH